MGDCQFRKEIKNNDKYVNIFNRAKEHISHVKTRKSIETVQNTIKFIHFYTIQERINRKKHN